MSTRASVGDLAQYVDDELRIRTDVELPRHWRRDVACVKRQDLDFEVDDPSPEVIDVCAGCPVRIECLVDDLSWVAEKAADLSQVDGLDTLREHPDLFSCTRGGLSARQRELLSKVNYRRLHVLAECHCGQWFTHLLGAELGQGDDGVGTPSSRGCCLECIRANPQNKRIKRLGYDPEILPLGIRSRSAKLGDL